ncbi:MAG: flagellin [Chloroflexi bacterium]|nr:flagellin [Chloroflexota bacterium]
MRINNNIMALNAQRNLMLNSTNLSKHVERLSSGLRINRAGDDAAGLSISEKLRGQIRGTDQAVRNSQDGISMIQTAEGALTETHAILQRMRELSVQATNDTLQSADRTAIASELSQLNTEVDRIANNTQFNGKTLLTGSLNTSLAGGSELQQGLSLATANVVVSKVDVTNAAAGTTFALSSTAAGKITLTNNTTAVSQEVSISAMTATGTSTQTLDFSTLGVKLTLSGFDASGTAANLVTDLTATANDTLLTAAAGSATLQIGANQNQNMAISISDMRSSAIGTSAVVNYTTLSAAVTQFGIDLNTTGANNLILNLDNAIADVSANRSKLGAYQNRLEHTIANLSVASENLSASESRVRDADMAAEMVAFTKRNILQQAGTSILAQANQGPQAVLGLLR